MAIQDSPSAPTQFLAVSRSTTTMWPSKSQGHEHAAIPNRGRARRRRQLCRVPGGRRLTDRCLGGDPGDPRSRNNRFYCLTRRTPGVKLALSDGSARPTRCFRRGGLGGSSSVRRTPTSPLQASRLTSRTHSQTTPVQLERVVAESNRTRRTGEPRHNRTRAQCKGSSREVVSTCNTAGVKLAPGLTFSWKRAIGITAAKRKIARATRIPTSRQGRRAKLGRWFGIK